jgi:hypothetical protein
MHKINFYLESRLASIKKRAATYSCLDPAAALKAAREWQVKYGRKGWRAYDSANHYDDEGALCLESLDGYNATPIQDISRRAFDYSGYYADSFQSELIRPYIVTIKTARGLFICPAVDYSDSDIATIYINLGVTVPKNARAQDLTEWQFYAARRADSLADSIARDSRECDAENQAILERGELTIQIKEARQTARGLIAAIKAQRKAGIDLTGAICDALTDKLKEYRREIIKARERRDALAENYWLSVEGY